MAWATELLNEHAHQVGAIVYEFCEPETMSARQYGERE